MVKKDTNEKQTIKEHLYKTAKLAEQNAVDVFRSAAHGWNFQNNFS